MIVGIIGDEREAVGPPVLWDMCRWLEFRPFLSGSSSQSQHRLKLDNNGRLYSLAKSLGPKGIPDCCMSMTTPATGITEGDGKRR